MSSAGVVETISIEANGFTFTAGRAGAAGGDVVLLLHGYPNSRHSWTEVMVSLAEAGFLAIAPDQRGYSPGARPQGIEAYATSQLVADALAIAAAIGGERFHLVGHDWGGQIAWLAAARHPERVRTLTILSRPHPAAFANALENDPNQAGRSRHHKAFQDPDMADRLLAGDAQAIRNTLCFENARGLFGTEEGGGAPKRRMSDEVAARHLSVLSSREAMDAALNWYRATFRGGPGLARPDLPPVLVPTLYLWGTEDMSVGEMAARSTADFVAGDYSFRPVEGAGHFLAEEVPHVVSACLLDHLSTHPGSRPS